MLIISVLLSLFKSLKFFYLFFNDFLSFFGGAGEIRTRVQIRKHRTVYMLSHLLVFRSEYAG